MKVSSLLKKQYMLYQESIEIYKDKQKEHLTFINQWVHQMKTPLSVINLIVQENEQETYMDSIKNELEKLDMGLDMALYMARFDTFTHDFHVDKVKLKPLIKQVINNMRRYFIVNNVFPEVDIDEDIMVFSDIKWLVFIVEQVIINAIKYSCMKSNKIYIKSYKEKNKVKLSIIDNGVGIPKKDIKRVFDQFYTGENGRKFGESTGMGLYIAGEVCKELSHDIEIESEEGTGTTVNIIFD
ncbi:sensor histidine kinase [Gottschalkia acidurici]|nr:sensor histidine kinase [Gottschalkia acidurici]